MLDQPVLDLVIGPGIPEGVLGREVVVPDPVESTPALIEVEWEHILDQIEHLVAWHLGVALDDVVGDKPVLELRIAPGAPDGVRGGIVVLLHRIDIVVTAAFGLILNDVVTNEPVMLQPFV